MYAFFSFYMLMLYASIEEEEASTRGKKCAMHIDIYICVCVCVY